jgi:hypothetical protein
MGVVLGTDAGPVTITWTNAFFPYGVEVFHDRIEEHLVLGEDGPERIGPRPGSGSVWDGCYFGTAIRGTAFHWERLTLGPSTRADGTVVEPARTVDVPVALRVDFDTGAVWFAAAMPEFPDPRRVFVPGDEILVVFSAEKMRDMGFTDPAFLR